MLSGGEDGPTDRQRFLRFLLVGGLAAGLNVAARWFLDFALAYEVAVALAYLVGMIAAFAMSRRFVFERSEAPLPVQFGRFAVVNMLAFAQVWLVSVGLARLLFPAVGFAWHSDTLAHLIGVASPIVTSYLGHRHFSFRR